MKHPLFLQHLLCAALLLLAANAWGHARLHTTLPTDNAVVATAPDRITLQFSEPIVPVHVHLINSQGQHVATGKLHAANGKLELPLPTQLVTGSYLVSYRVISLDSHLVKGSFTFSVGTGPDAAMQAKPSAFDPDSPSWLTALAHLNRALYFIALLTAAGSALFRVVLPLPLSLMLLTARTIPFTALLACVTALLNLGLTGVLISGGGLDQLLTPDSWSGMAQSSLASSTGVALAGLLILILASHCHAGTAPDPNANSVPAPSSGPDAALAIGASLSVFSLGLSGHAVTTPPLWLMTPALIGHALMAAFWLGALWTLHALLRAPSEAAARSLLAAFSHRATAMLAILLTTAALLIWLQLEQPGDFLTTDYGLLLSAKIILVLGMLGLAALNRWFLSPALAASAARAKQRLRAAIGAEILLAIGIISVTAVLGTTPPPRATTEISPTAVVPDTTRQAIVSADSLTLSVSVTPAKAGHNQLELSFQQDDGTIFEPQEVTLIWTLEKSGMEPLVQQATDAQNGVYQLQHVALIIAGTWHLRVEALIDNFTKTVFQTHLQID